MTNLPLQGVAGQFIRFVGVGCMSAVGHFGLLIALVAGFAVSAVLASAAGALLGALINYTLNYHVTFRSSLPHGPAVLKFGVIAIVGLFLNTLLMWIAVDIVGAHYLIGQVVTTGLVLVWSFTCNRLWTFQGVSQTAGERG